MKTNSVRQNGFIIIFVVAMIALISTAMYVLTSGSNTLLFESDTAYLQAVQRNLVVSGLAWARCSIENENTEIFDRAVQLDVTDMGVRGASLTVTIAAPKDGRAEVRINSSVSRGRRTLSHKGEYYIRTDSKKPGL